MWYRNWEGPLYAFLRSICCCCTCFRCPLHPPIFFSSSHRPNPYHSPRLIQNTQRKVHPSPPLAVTVHSITTPYVQTVVCSCIQTSPDTFESSAAPDLRQSFFISRQALHLLILTPTNTYVLLPGSQYVGYGCFSPLFPNLPDAMRPLFHGGFTVQKWFRFSFFLLSNLGPQTTPSPPR